MTTVSTEVNPVRVAKRLKRRIRKEAQRGELRNGMHISSASFNELSPLGKKIVRTKVEGYMPIVFRHNAPTQPLKVVWDEQLHRFVALNT